MSKRGRKPLNWYGKEFHKKESESPPLKKPKTLNLIQYLRKYFTYDNEKCYGFVIEFVNERLYRLRVLPPEFLYERNAVFDIYHENELKVSCVKLKVRGVVVHKNEDIKVFEDIYNYILKYYIAAPCSAYILKNQINHSLFYNITKSNGEVFLKYKGKDEIGYRLEYTEDDKIIVHFLQCEGFCLRKSGNKRCEKCRKQCNHFFKKGDSLRIVKMDEKPIEVSKNTRLEDLIKLARKTGKVTPESQFWKLVHEQFRIRLSGNKKPNYDEMINTLSLGVTLSIEGVNGLRGNFLPNGDHTSPIILPSQNTISKWKKMFSYSPGLQEFPVYAAGVVLSLFSVEKARFSIQGDEVCVKRQLVRCKIGELVFYIGLVDYDKSSGALKGLIAKNLRKAKLGIKDCQKGKEMKSIIDEILDSMEFVLQKEKQPFCATRKILATCFGVETILSSGEDAAFFFPGYYFFQDTMSKKEAGAIIQSSIIHLQTTLIKMSEEFPFFSNSKVDSIVWDSESGVMSFFRKIGRNINCEKGYYGFYFVIPFFNEKKKLTEFLYIHIFNDGEHLKKEVMRKVRRSTGYDDSAVLIIIPKVESSEYYYDVYRKKVRIFRKLIIRDLPLTMRPFVVLWKLDRLKPAGKRTKITSDALWPTERQQQRTVFSSVFFQKRTRDALNEIIKLLKEMNEDDRKKWEVENGCTLLEAEACLEFIDLYQPFFLATSKKTQHSDYDKYVVLSTKNKIFFIEDYIKEFCNKREDFSVNNHKLGTSNTLKKTERICNSYISIVNTRKNDGFSGIADSFASTDRSEGLFREQRKSSNGIVTCETFWRNSGVVLLKNPKIKKNEHNSYQCQNLHSHFLLNAKESLKKVKKYRDEQEEKLKELVLKDCSKWVVHIEDLKEKLKKQDYEYLENRIGGMLFKSMKRGGKQSLFIKNHLITEDSELSKKTIPKKEFLKLFVIVENCILNLSDVPIMLKNVTIFEQKLRFLFGEGELFDNATKILETFTRVRSSNKILPDTYKKLLFTFIKKRVGELFGDVGVAGMNDVGNFRKNLKGGSFQ